MQDLSILRMAGALAQHASARHKMVARNVAHSDTPGYRAQDLESFSLPKPGDLKLAATRPGHMSGGARARFEAVFSTAEGAASPNGNDVAIDDQMARAAEAQSDFGRATAIYSKTLDILRAGLRSS